MGVNAPMKRSGFKQGIFEISATKKEEIGTLRITQNGKKFRYARAGTSALSAGKMGQAAAIAANVTNQASPAAVAVGSRSIAYTAGGAVTYAEDYFAGGDLHINDAAGEGHAYPIKSSSAVAAGTAITLILEQGIKVALTTSSEFTLVHSPWMAVVESTTEEALPVGIPQVAVTGNYYYWAQTGGPAIVLASDTAAVGFMLAMAATAGSVKAMNETTLDFNMPYLGINWGTAHVAGEYKPVYLLID